MYESVYDPGWTNFLQQLDGVTKSKVEKKIAKILGYPRKRHLKGAPFL